MTMAAAPSFPHSPWPLEPSGPALVSLSLPTAGSLCPLGQEPAGNGAGGTSKGMPGGNCISFSLDPHLEPFHSLPQGCSESLMPPVLPPGWKFFPWSSHPWKWNK